MSIEPVEPPIEQRTPDRAERFSLHVLQFGALAIVFAVSGYKVFELDRFLVPKELVLHAIAVIAALFAFGAIRRVVLTRVDLLLLGFLVLGVVSVAAATNVWLGIRALAVSASAVLVFWSARGLGKAGLERPLLNAVAVAVVLACVTALVQAYGVRLDLFAVDRAPGGTLGNRNFVGHAAAFGLPVVLLAALRARRAAGSLAGVAGTGLVIATLVLTRSRAAWIAAAAVILVLFGALLVSPQLRRDGRTWRRLAVIVIACGAAIAAAMLIPNALRWRSDNPYLESVTGVVEYDEGSGRGRLVQYEQSLRMAASDPIVGAGPGNWPVEYAAHAARHDPSLNPSEPGTTYNPWPSSDWIAFISERGFAAALLLGIAFVSMASGALGRLRRESDADQALQATALLGTLAATALAGAFDAVLLLGLPALLVWTAVGALYESKLPPRAAPGRAIAVIAVIVMSAAGAARSATQLLAMDIYATRSDRASLERAASIDPGSYRVHLRLAKISRKQRCEHARAAHDLLPHAESARALAAGCR